jgi:hypothetical protein
MYECANVGFEGRSSTYVQGFSVCWAVPLMRYTAQFAMKSFVGLGITVVKGRSVRPARLSPESNSIGRDCATRFLLLSYRALHLPSYETLGCS